MKPCIFLDRDGILNQVIFRNGKPASPRSVGELLVMPHALELVNTIKLRGYLAIVVTNQPDVGRGFLSETELNKIHKVIKETLPVDCIYTAFSGEKDDPTRKPNPTMLLAAGKVWDIDYAKSWIIGDSIKDIVAGRKAGISTILLKTEYNIEAHDMADKQFCSIQEITKHIKQL